MSSLENERRKYVELYEDPDGRYPDPAGYGARNWGKAAEFEMDLLQPSSLVDVGCGQGHFCVEMAKRGVAVHGVDFASVRTSSVLDCRHVLWHDADACNLPIDDEAVEYVTSFDVLEHCREKDIPCVLGEFDRVSTKGAVLKIAFRQARERSFQGEYLHMTVRKRRWWLRKIRQRFPHIMVRKGVITALKKKVDVPLVVFGISANLGFAVGTALIGIKQRNPDWNFRCLVLHNGLNERDRKAMTKVHPASAFLHYTPPAKARLLFGENSAMRFSRFEMYRFLSLFRHVVWLDADIIPVGAFDDVLSFSDETGIAMRRGWVLWKNFRAKQRASLGTYDLNTQGYNDGVVVVSDRLPCHSVVSDWCLKAVERWCGVVTGAQAIHMLMIQHFGLEVNALPPKYNCKRKRFDPAARIVHFSGIRNPWSRRKRYPLWGALHDEWQEVLRSV